MNSFILYSIVQICVLNELYSLTLQFLNIYQFYQLAPGILIQIFSFLNGWKVGAF